MLISCISASGVSFPVGFKNATAGSVGIAIDAMRSASNPHAFMGINPQGLAAIVRTSGNPHLHVILRGSSDGPNYKAEFVKKARDDMVKARKDFHPSIMIDCSHGNSEKNHNNQPKVLADICTQLQAGDTSITGVMIEGHFHAGRQDVPPEGPSGLKWGVSLTDACCSFETTMEMLDSLNKVRSLLRSLKHVVDPVPGAGCWREAQCQVKWQRIRPFFNIYKIYLLRIVRELCSGSLFISSAEVHCKCTLSVRQIYSSRSCAQWAGNDGLGTVISRLTQSVTRSRTADSWLLATLHATLVDQNDTARGKV